MDAITYLNDYSKRSDKFLRTFLAKKKKKAVRIDPRVKNILEIFEDYALGGKKVRGGLTVLGYEVAGGKNNKLVLPVSCGIEFLHNFLLIHDDVIDRDVTRRGKPTVHQIFYRQRNDRHYGNSMAILIGDVGAFLGYELITTSNFSKVKITKALTTLNEYLLKTGYGQLMDIEFDFKKKVSWDEIFKVRTYKTAYYTIVMPLAVGAVLGGANNRQLKALESYGVPVGLAFQLVDDVLGVFGNSKITGKSNEGDIREGKKTLLFAKSVEMAGKADKKFLLKWYGNEELDKEKVKIIREIIIKSGAYDYSLEKANKLVEEGKTKVAEITKNPEYQKILKSLADFVVARDK